MTYREWRNVTAALSFIDRREFESVLPPVVAPAAMMRWQQFNANPAAWLLRADDATAAKVFELAFGVTRPDSA